MAAGPAARVSARWSRHSRRAAKPRATSLAQAQRRAAILERLRHEYEGARTALDFGTPYQLLLAVILSAQCTDKRVNLVTPSLFAAFPTAEDMARSKQRTIERYIKTCGLYHSKAKNIINASRMIVERFAGQVPKAEADLLSLPGVGRKTANVVRSVAFDVDAIAVDTHVFRVANRLGLVRAKTPREAEKQLMLVVPKPDWSKAHHWLIHHGRAVCHARRPECARCVVVDLCPSAKRFLTQ